MKKKVVENQKYFIYLVITIIFTLLSIRNTGNGEYYLWERSPIEKWMSNNRILLIAMSTLMFATISKRRLEKIIRVRRNDGGEIGNIFRKLYIGIATILVFIIVRLSLEVPYINNQLYLPVRGFVLYGLSWSNIIGINPVVIVSVISSFLIIFGVYWMFDYKLASYLLSYNLYTMRCYIQLKVHLLSLIKRDEKRRITYLNMLFLYGVEKSIFNKRRKNRVFKVGNEIIKYYDKNNKNYSKEWQEIFFVETVYSLLDIKYQSCLEDKYTLAYNEDLKGEKKTCYFNIYAKNEREIRKFSGGNQHYEICFILRKFFLLKKLSNREYGKSLISRILNSNKEFFTKPPVSTQEKILVILVNNLNREIVKENEKKENINSEKTEEAIK